MHLCCNEKLDFDHRVKRKLLTVPVFSPFVSYIFVIGNDEIIKKYIWGHGPELQANSSLKQTTQKS